MGRDLIKKAIVMANEEMNIGIGKKIKEGNVFAISKRFEGSMNREVYEWYLQNGTFDDELLKIMQLECFNKRIEPVKTISYQEIGNMLSSDSRFNDSRLSMRWWWIFDSKYALISSELLDEILSELKDIDNPWTIVAIVQSVTGLNCGFVFYGLRKEGNEITKEEISGCGFLTDKGIRTFVNGGEVNDIVIGVAIFD